MTNPEHLAKFKIYQPMVRIIVGGFQKKLPRSILREDLMAAGEMGLWEAITKGTLTEGSHWEWYARIRVRGAILDELRRQDWAPRRARWTYAEDFKMDHLEIEDEPREETPDMVEFEQVAKIAAAVETLPERLKEIMILHLVEGVKLKDIAVKLGVSGPRVSQLHSKAVEYLKKAVA